MTKGYQMNFNQDFTSISVLNSNGLRLYSISGQDKVDEIYTSDNMEQVRIVERLFNSSLVVVVTKEKPNCLKMMHFKKKQDICNCLYPSEVLCVRMNRQRLVVCLVESIHIHDIRDMKILHSIDNIAPNELGLCALSLNSHLAFPISTTSGELRIFNAQKLRTGLTIKAHDSPLSALNFSPCGSLLATASERGTVIRVFNVKNGQRVQEFRRGVKRCVRIASLVFSANGEFLCATSNTETVHIFKIDGKAVEAADTKPLFDEAQRKSTTVNTASAATTTTVKKADGKMSAASSKVAKQSVKSSTGSAITTTTTTTAVATTTTKAKSTVDNKTTTTTNNNSTMASTGGWSDYFSKAVSSYLIPTQVCDVLAQDRAFATVVVAQPGLKHICALTFVQKELKLLLACEDGFLYIHDFNAERGGQCKLQVVHDLRGALEGVIELNLTESMERMSVAANASVLSGIMNAEVATCNIKLKSCAASVLIQNPDPVPDNSYAGILKGSQTSNTLTDSAKYRKLCDAIDTPTKLYDERQFPPVAIAAKD